MSDHEPTDDLRARLARLESRTDVHDLIAFQRIEQDQAHRLEVDGLQHELAQSRSDNTRLELRVAALQTVLQHHILTMKEVAGVVVPDGHWTYRSGPPGAVGAGAKDHWVWSKELEATAVPVTQVVAPGPPLPFRGLPVEIATQVMSLLPRAALAACATVNKTFLKIAKDQLYEDPGLDMTRCCQFLKARMQPGLPRTKEISEALMPTEVTLCADLYSLRLRPSLSALLAPSGTRLQVSWLSLRYPSLCDPVRVLSCWLPCLQCFDPLHFDLRQTGPQPWPVPSTSIPSSTKLDTLIPMRGEWDSLRSVLMTGSAALLNRPGLGLVSLLMLLANGRHPYIMSATVRLKTKSPDGTIKEEVIVSQDTTPDIIRPLMTRRVQHARSDPYYYAVTLGPR